MTALTLEQSLQNCATKNILIIALDIEGFDMGHIEKNWKFQIGLCTLDTRHLQQRSTKDD
jgi:hypothetical protein